MTANDTVVISDASCLIALDNIGELNILSRCFSKVFITPEVATEFEKPLPDFINIRVVQNIDKKEELSMSLDSGEASAITLALEMPEAILIIDEKKGRALAKKLQLKIIGTLKVLLIAKQKSIITEIKPIIILLQQKGFRFSQSLLHAVLIEAGE